MSQLISRVQMRLERASGVTDLGPAHATRPPTTVSQTGLSGSSSAGATTGSTPSPVRSARIPTRMRPATALLAGRVGGRERVARERLLGGQRLVGQDGELLGRRRQPPQTGRRRARGAGRRRPPASRCRARAPRRRPAGRASGTRARRARDRAARSSCRCRRRAGRRGGRAASRRRRPRAGIALDEVVRERLEVLEPVAHAVRRARADVGVEREAHGGVADRVRRELEAGAREARRSRRAIRSGSGQKDVEPLAVGVRRLEPGRAGVDHAVGEELRHAAAPQPPAGVAQRAAASSICLVASVGRDPQRDAQAHRQLVRALEVAQQVDASRARRPSRARRSGRAR